MVTSTVSSLHRDVAQDAEIGDRQHRDLRIGDLFQRGKRAFAQRGGVYHVAPG